MKRSIILFVILQSITFSETVIQLPESQIQSDYLEINKMKNTKNVIVVEKKDIEEKGYANVSTVLQDIPTINVNTSAWGNVDIRGQGAGNASKNLQVLVDGAPITTLINHPLQTNYDVVPVENIERIEVIPGGGSIIYGSGTAGGVINITTNLSRLQKPVNLVEVAAGTGGEKYNLSFGHKIHDKVNLQVSYLRNNQDLYFKNTYRNSDYFTAGVNVQMTENQNVSLRYSTLSEDGQFIRNSNYKRLKEEGKNYKPTPFLETVGLDENGKKIQVQKEGYSNAKRKFESANLSYRWAPTSNTKYLLDGFYNKGHFTNGATDEIMNHHTYGLKNKFDVSYGENTAFDGSSLLIGLDSYRQDSTIAYNDYQYKRDKKKYVIKPLFFKYQKDTLAFYLLNTLKYENWESSQGIRKDYTYWSFNKLANKNEGKGKSHRHNTNYEFSLAYRYRDTGRVYARYEKGFTSPDGMEISDDLGKGRIEITKGEDEIYDLYEIGWREYLGFTTVNLTAFYSKTDNEISRNLIFVPKVALYRKTINILKTERKGIELSLSQKFGKLELMQSYAYLTGKRAYNGREGEFIKPTSRLDWSESGLMKVPKHSVTLEANYQFTPRFSAGVKYKYSGKYNNFSTLKEKINQKGDAYIKSRAVTDVSLRYQHENGITLYGGINNIFNEKYFEYVTDLKHSVIPADERNYFVGMKYTF